MSSYGKTAVILTAAVALLWPSRGAHPEYVFRKDGSIVQGTIVRDDAAAISVRDAKGAIVRVERSNIMRILYTKLYMGKVYIRLTTGSVLEGYVVDEDQNNYTVRRELYSPRELTVPRDRVMFVARTNP
ncbi:MAG: hypothetical protein JXA20_20310, partial [Spirochaetes bacterium]|nr:hypothetical protein [Spirochaetota bacterium]